MRKFELGSRGTGAPQQQIPLPPKMTKPLRTKQVVRIWPPKSMGYPNDGDCYIYDVTEQDLEIKLRSEHYDHGGVYLSIEEYNERFLKIGQTNSEMQYAPQPTLPDFSLLSDDDYTLLHSKLVNFLYDNNYATKAVLKKLTVEDMAEKYKIPYDLYTLTEKDKIKNI
jgi:hypothetical protein